MRWTPGLISSDDGFGSDPRSIADGARLATVELPHDWAGGHAVQDNREQYNERDKRPDGTDV